MSFNKVEILCISIYFHMGKCQFNEANVYIPTFVDDMLQDIMFIFVYIYCLLGLWVFQKYFLYVKMVCLIINLDLEPTVPSRPGTGCVLTPTTPPHLSGRKMPERVPNSIASVRHKQKNMMRDFPFCKVSWAHFSHANCPNHLQMFSFRWFTTKRLCVVIRRSTTH